jgi:hypothetical protein
MGSQRGAKEAKILPCFDIWLSLGAASRRQPRPSRAGYRMERSAGGVWRCCQTNRNFSPFGTARAGERSLQAERDCHSAKAAELVGLSINEVAV